MKKYIILIFLLFTVTAGFGQDRYDAVLKARALSAQGDDNEALAVLSAEIGRGATAGLYQARAEVHIKMSEIKEAINDFMAAENLEAGSGLYGLARCAAINGDSRAAVSYLEAHLKSGSKRKEPEILIDSTFDRIINTPEWKILWKKEWYKGFERSMWEVEHYLSIGKTELAEEAYTNLAVRYPEMPVTEYCKGIISIAGKKYRDALEILEPLSVDMDNYPPFVIALAKAKEGEGNYFASANAYGMLIKSEYPDAGLYLLRAEMFFRAGDHKAARSDLEKYLSYYPDDFKAISLLSQTLGSEGAVYEAMPYLNRNIENHPGEPGSFALRGDAWFSVRTWDKAVEDYTMSLDLDPNNATVNLNLGISLINIGKTEDACHYLNKAKGLGEKRASQYLGKYCIR